MTRGLPTKKVYVGGDHARLYADVREYKKYLHLVTGVNRTGLHVALKTTDKKLTMRRYRDLVHRLEKARQNVIDGVAQPAVVERATIKGFTPTCPGSGRRCGTVTRLRPQHGDAAVPGRVLFRGHAAVRVHHRPHHAVDGPAVRQTQAPHCTSTSTT